MKKISFFIAFLTLATVTGCNKSSKLTCTQSKDFTTAKLDTETVITFKGDYATKTETTMQASFDNEESAKSFAEKYEDKDDYKVEQSGTSVTIKNVQEVSKDSAKSDDNKKSKVKEYLESKSFECK